MAKKKPATPSSSRRQPEVVDSPPATSGNVVEAKATKRRFRVELPHCPSTRTEFEADDEAEAVQAFNAHNGIRQTDHKHIVEQLA